MNLDYYIIPFLMNFKMNTGYLYLDSILYGFLFIMVFCVDRNKVKLYSEKLINYYESYNKNKITMKFDDNSPYDRPKAVIDYMIKYCTINGLKMHGFKIWDHNDSLRFEDLFIISQKNKIKINNNLYAYMIIKQKEERGRNDNYIYKDYYELTIESKKLSVKEINEWINDKLYLYKEHLKTKGYDKQLLLSVAYNKKIKITSCDWSSSVSFENSYFPNKDEIIKKIDFFLNNKEWYYKKGIPYNLGILLYGEPGCGKTRFIKQLLNYTNRHAIDIKLNDNFDFNILKRIINEESIGDNYIIPQDKRIIIFEDIDAMTTILKDRYKVEKEKDELKNLLKTSIDDNKIEILNNNNNLSYFLNIIDGLNECSGRIIIMTTNCIDYLDKAIIRPGRIDMKLEFKKLSCNDIKNMIKHFWDIDLKVNIKYNKKYTSADLISIFRGTDDFNTIKNQFI
jgi:hypothetical protein